MDLKGGEFPGRLEHGHTTRRSRVPVAVGLALLSAAALVSHSYQRFFGFRWGYGDVHATRPPFQPGWSWSNIEPSRSLVWHECFEDGGYDCARLDVPMDWQDPNNNQRVILAISRLRAVNTDDYRGPIIFNPGGPGGSGVFALRDRGKYLQDIVGDNYDIVSFDPRGVGASTPRHQCFESTSDERNWAFQDPGVIGSHSNVVADLYARSVAYSRSCEISMAGTGLLEHSGSVPIARDMLEIVNQAGHDQLLRYWGFSWGTILGGMFAAQYPDKVERLVSDGNVDYREWFRSEHRNFLHDTEKVMQAFYDSCHEAGPEKCALYSETPAAIERRLDALFELLKQHPVIILPTTDAAGPSMPMLVSHSRLKQLLFSTLYQPLAQFANFATIAAALEQGDGMPYYEHYHPAQDEESAPSPLCGAPPLTPFDPWPDFVEGTGDAFPAVRCSDHNPPLFRNVTLEDMAREAEELMQWSPSTGALSALHSLKCVGRTTEPKWTFEAEFGGRTRHPILYVNNFADNITPLISARNNSAGFPGSVVLVQKSYGHTTLAAPSECTRGHIRRYFQDGTLPDADTECDAPWAPFDRDQGTEARVFRVPGMYGI